MCARAAQKSTKGAQMYFRCHFQSQIVRFDCRANMNLNILMDQEVWSYNVGIVFPSRSRLKNALKVVVP